MITDRSWLLLSPPLKGSINLAEGGVNKLGGMLSCRGQLTRRSTMLENYASTQINLTGLTEEEKKQKLEAATQVVKILTDSLGVKGLPQNMLATQLLGIHDLQQKLLPYAARSMNYPEDNQSFINAITKLSNTFIQQLTLLQKLQGNCQQKVVVEHLHINEGGQAIVGQVNAHKKEGGNGK